MSRILYFVLLAILLNSLANYIGADYARIIAVLVTTGFLIYFIVDFVKMRKQK